MPRLKTLANVNIGLAANDGTGDLIRDSFIKINNNLNGIYSNGQFLAYNPDTRLTPGYTWIGDKDTGIYRPGSGKIAFSLNGNESLVLNEDATIRWFGSELATKEFVTQELSSVFGTNVGGVGTGTPGGGVPITVVDSSGSVIGETTSFINGIPVVTSLPTVGNYEGRFSYYNGDVWIFSCYPPGNGIGLPADSSIGRTAGSDCRWTRFRGEGAVTVGTSLPDSGVEGQVFYNATSNTLFYYVGGQWKTAASVVVPDAPSGFTILTSLPPTNDPDNFEGRTIVVGNVVYIFRSGAWVNFSTYVSGDVSGGGIPAGATLPSTVGRNVGELFRKTGTGAGLYAFNGVAWVTLSTYTRDIGATAGIKKYSALPADVNSFSAGDLIIVDNEIYILNDNKTSWDLFRPGGGSGSIVTIEVSANSIGTDQLKAGAVTADKILGGTITGDKIDAGTITGDNIAGGTITAAKIQTGAIGASQINADSIATAVLATGRLTAGTIEAGSIGAEKLNVVQLSSITQNAGTITAGILKSGDNKMIIDLNNKFIRIEL
jgi:hypothetical protein